MKWSDLREALDRKTMAILIPNSTVFAAVTLADIEVFLKLLLLTVTIIYTLWKWVKEARKDV